MAKKQDNAAIYRDFEAKTADLHAWTVHKGGEYVAKIVCHYGGRRSPNGLTVKAFVHVFGLPMVRGIARGGGYDMKTAATLAAAHRLPVIPEGDIMRAQQPAVCEVLDAFRNLKDNGHDVAHQLREMGYAVEWVV